MYTNVYKSNISYENGFPLLSEPLRHMYHKLQLEIVLTSSETVKTIHKVGHLFGTLVFFFFFVLSMQTVLNTTYCIGGCPVDAALAQSVNLIWLQIIGSVFHPQQIIKI